MDALEPGVIEQIKGAMLRERNGDLDGAILVVDGLVKSHQQSVAVLLLAGQLHLTAAKRAGEQVPVPSDSHLARAILLVDKAKRLTASNLGVSRIHAHVLLQANRLDEAYAEISRAIRLPHTDDPQDLRFDEYDVNDVFLDDDNDADEDQKQKKADEDHKEKQDSNQKEDSRQKLKRKLRELHHGHLSRIETVGKSKIVITEYDKVMGGTKKTPGLRYHVGKLKFNGAGEQHGRKTTVLSFVDDNASQVHDLLISISHSHILKSLGYGRGTGAYSAFSFLALPFFDTTFEMYLEDIELSTYMDRYTEDFISLISDVVKAILALHSAGYCCKGLKGKHIAVIKEHGSISAKIWLFKKCLSDKDKDQDWINLGELLQKSKVKSQEMREFCDQLRAGELRGMDILAHSAVLTVRKKFQNVLALFFHQNTRWKTGSEGAAGWLDKECKWYKDQPWWIEYQASGHGIQPDTRRGFCEKLRNLIEHEVDFLDPTMVNRPTFAQQERGTIQTDLECSMRQAWTKATSELQSFVTKSKLKY